ncbi:type 2 periplasmic-binding domain-containing protein [Pseudoalteromonas sp. GB56]
MPPEQVVELAVAKHLPPYFFKSSSDGIEQQIIEQAMQMAGLGGLKLHYLSYPRAELELASGTINGAVNIPKESNVQGYYSDTLLYFQNVAVTLTKNDMSVDSIEDLSHYRVFAFGNAHKYLGERYAKAVEGQADYEEFTNQFAQITHLMSGHAQVIVLDKRIFTYYLRMYERNNPSLSVTIHPIFEPSPRHIVFNSQEMRDQFNRGLASLKSTQGYLSILASAQTLAMIEE